MKTELSTEQEDSSFMHVLQSETSKLKPLALLNLPAEP